MELVLIVLFVLFVRRCLKEAAKTSPVPGFRCGCKTWVTDDSRYCTGCGRVIGKPVRASVPSDELAQRTRKRLGYVGYGALGLVALGFVIGFVAIFPDAALRMLWLSLLCWGVFSLISGAVESGIRAAK